MLTHNLLFTCYLFAGTLNEEGAVCVLLNAKGEAEKPAGFQNFSEIHALQNRAQTVIVAPAIFFSLHWAHLPPLTEKKLQMAVPYALEEQLAGSLPELHFAFDRRYYINGRYLVAVCEKEWLDQLVLTLENKNIHFDLLTLDWFALKNQETLITDNYWLIHNNVLFCGALKKELTDFYLQQCQPEVNNYTCEESFMIPKTAVPLETDSRLWIAKRLHENKFINILQGKNSRQFNKSRRWYLAAGAIGLMFLLSIPALNVMKLYSLNKQLHKINAEIALIYHKFFPGATQIISPKFRITQLLKAQSGQTDQAFWILLNHLSNAITLPDVQIMQIRYQQQRLLVSLDAHTFKTLEDVQTRLKKQSVKVKQMQASSQNKRAVGTLELTL